MSDPWRKIVAVGLAIGLWFVIDLRVSKTFALDSCSFELVDPLREAPPGRIPQGATIEILVSPRDYGTAGYFDAGSDNSPITAIRLEFTGASHLINRLRENERVSVELPPSVRPDADQPEFEFSMRDLRFRDEEFATVLSAMRPARVKVRLYRKQELELVPLHAHLHIVTPKALTDRLDLGGMQFTPEAIKLRGTVTALDALRDNLSKIQQSGVNVEKLFNIDLKRWAHSPRREVIEPITLRERWRVQHGIEMEPVGVQVTIPLSPAFSTFKLMVPVQLVMTRSTLANNAFEDIADVEVILSAASPLDAELGFKSEPQLKDWARENLCVLAALPKGAEPGEIPLLEGTLMFLNQPYIEGTHYRVEKHILINAVPRKRTQ